MSTETIPVERVESEKSQMTRWAVLIGSGVIGTSLAQAAALRIPFQNLLKSSLGASREQTAAFFAVIGMAWYFKPLVGIVIDSVPLFGTRRRHYLMLGSVFATIIWLLIPLTSHKYSTLLVTTTAMETMLIVGSTVIGAIMVEGGQKFGATGRLSSVRNFFEEFTILVAGPLGGYLAVKSFGWTAITGALIALSVAPVAYFMLREPRIAQTNKESLRKSKLQLKALFKSGTLWSAAGMLFLVYIVPGFATPIYYYQTDTLKFSQQFIGTLAAVSGGMGMLGALFYAVVCRRISLRNMMYLAIALNATFTLTYLFYNSAIAAIFIDGQNGFVFTLAELAMMDLAARATPKGNEAMGFALMMSIRNISLIGISDVLGSWLMDKHHFTFHNLVWLNSTTTALVIIAIPFLPKILVDSSDAKAA